MCSSIEATIDIAGPSGAGNDAARSGGGGPPRSEPRGCATAASAGGIGIPRASGKRRLKRITQATVTPMVTLADASLSPAERRALDRLVELLRDEFGEHLHGVWLYGSRARGEVPHDESDVDLLIVSDEASLDDIGRTIRRIDEAVAGEDIGPVLISAQMYTPERIAQRRAIRSFFMQEVDRDKIVLYGDR